MANMSVNIFICRLLYFAKLFCLCKVTLFLRSTKENFKVVNAEDAAVAYFAHLAGLEQLYVAPTAIKGIAQGYDVAEFEYRVVGLPYGNIHGAALLSASAGAQG